MAYNTPREPRPAPECQEQCRYEGQYHTCEYGLADHTAHRCACGYFWSTGNTTGLDYEPGRTRRRKKA